MARIRTVKPEYWTDERIGECSVSARLLFIASWNFADDHGGLDRSAKQLKAQAFPYDNIDCEPLVQELLDQRLLIEYEVDGKKYLHIKGFRTHQKVEKPARPRVPLYEQDASPPRVLHESSPSPPRLVAVSSLEGNVMEGKGRDVCMREPIPEVAQAVHSEEFRKLKSTYPAFTGRQDWLNAEHYCRVRIDRDGATWPQLIEAVSRYRAYCDAGGVSGPQYVMTPGKFFSADDKPWEHLWTSPPTKSQVKQDKNISVAQQWLAQQEAKDASN